MSMSAPSRRYELQGTGSPGGSERASSNNRLESYVMANIGRLERLMHKEASATGLLDDVRNLLSWWSEFKTLRGMYAPEGRLAMAWASKSFAPLFADMITAGQASRLEALFTTHYVKINQLADRFMEGSGKLPGNAALAQEVKTAQSEMLGLTEQLALASQATR